MSRLRPLATSIALALMVSACGGADAVAPPVTATPAPSATAAPPVASAPADPLGPRPEPALTPPFQAPVPAVYTTSNGVTVWLLERHALPLVSVTVVIPTGASSDPKGEAGLVWATANMLDEGAGKLGALDYARAVDLLGAHVSTGATSDFSFAQVGVVRRNFAGAMQLLGDAIMRPRFDAKEWKRVHDLWENDLKQRASDPTAVAKVVQRVALFGADHPYGHPVDGFAATASKVQLADVKRFYGQAWRPDRAIVVAVGDVTKPDLDAQLDAALGAWKKPAEPPLPIVTPPPPAAENGAGTTKLVLVDRPDAPQSVVAWIRPGLRESDPRVAILERANIALGGGFTARLNQDLREEHGWTYGAFSGVASLRGVGSVQASASVITDKTIDAMKAMLADIDDFTRTGLTEAEVLKTRLLAQAEQVEQYETVGHASFAMAHDAALGLGPDWEAKSSVARDGADRHEMNKLASTFFDRSAATLVVVGPRAKLEGALKEAGFGAIDHRDAEGKPTK